MAKYRLFLAAILDSVWILAILLEKQFQLQEDNKKLSKDKKSVTHETFAAEMGYETDYKIALSNPWL